MRRYLFPPLALPFIILLVFLLPLLFILFAGTITLAFRKLGLPLSVAYTLFWASLIGSFINIPVKEVTSYRPIARVKEVSFFGVTYPVPYVDWGEQKTVIAVNVGGALVPLSIVSYEIVRLSTVGDYELLGKAFLATIIAALIIHSFAKPVRGLGIAVPTLIPPLIAIALALILGGNKPLIAYMSGTMGVLIGADLMNMKKIKELGAPMASIGGAGTFDGIFLAGILAVLLV
ncbi:hypothetical protein DRN39_00165 [Thermococci archaeon]|nr:MAG: hypothetical protein DRN39_00165 [Thermococci archaeon]